MKLKKACSGCFSSLACDVRIQIINLLKENGRTTAGNIAKHFQLRQPTISHHLKYLLDMGVVSSKKEGKNKFFYVDPKCQKDCNLFI